VCERERDETVFFSFSVFQFSVVFCIKMKKRQ
jgi:hypothetical protein